MATKGRGSTSSEGTGRSKSWEDVLALGERIVSELDLGDQPDTLSRWMAHRIAELMRNAVSARSKVARQAAAEECESLILRVWERRTSWPRGWPPPTAAKALERLSTPDDDSDASPFYRNQVKDDGECSWLGTLPRIGELHRREIEVWREAGLHQLDVHELTEWLEQRGAELSAGERLALECLADAGVSDRSRLRRLDPRLAPEEQVEPDPVDRLRELAIQREALIKRAAPSKRKPRGRKKAPRAADL